MNKIIIMLDANAIINPQRKLKSLVMYYMLSNKFDIQITSYIYEYELTDIVTKKIVAPLLNNAIQIVTSASNDVIYEYKKSLKRNVDMGEASCFHALSKLNDDDRKHAIFITDDKDAIKAAKTLGLNAMTINNFIECFRDKGHYEIKFANDLLKGLSINI